MNTPKISHQRYLENIRYKKTRELNELEIKRKIEESNFSHKREMLKEDIESIEKQIREEE